MPTACIHAYTMTGPTNLNPLPLSAFDISSDSGVLARILPLFWSGLPPAMFQANADKSCAFVRWQTDDDDYDSVRVSIVFIGRNKRSG